MAGFDRQRLPKDEGDRQIASVPANLLDRQFEAERSNQKWIADFTYIWTAEGWLYVSAVIDPSARRVVGWSMSASMTAQLVADALLVAVWRRGKPDALMHHSDRGSQYASEQFQRLMADSTTNEARADVFEYIERVYNSIRRHSTTGYVSPVEFERKVGLA